MKRSLVILFLSTCFCILNAEHYYNDYYVIKMPGHILPPDKFKRSLRPMSEYVQQDIYSTELDKKRYFQAIKNRELEGRHPYQESKKTATSTTYSY